MRIYVCGNPLVPEDSLPLKLLPVLKKKHPLIDFIEYDPTEDLPREKELIIIDTIINAKKVMVITDIDTFVQNKAISLHDCDLGMNLKIAKKIGWVKSSIIIGMPPYNGDIEEISKIIANLFSKNGQHSSYTGHMHE